MIKFEKTEIHGLEPAIRGMRNPMNSWDRSDSRPGLYGDEFQYSTGYLVGPKDLDLAIKLAKAGTEHAKYRRVIAVWVDITAPIFWWKEFDTYKVGTVRSSCSTMHKIHVKEFVADDFSVDLTDYGEDIDYYANQAFYTLLGVLEDLRVKYNESKNPRLWRRIIELLPESYNMRSTIMLNYEVLHAIYHQRRNHKLKEWHEFCDWIKTLPYSEVITCE